MKLNLGVAARIKPISDNPQISRHFGVEPAVVQAEVQATIMSTPSSADLPLRAPNKGRHIPPPLTIESSSYQSTSSIGSARRLSRRDSDTLLYDIPSSFSPPPVSPPAKHLQSPTSPNSRRSRSPRQPRPTPPPAVPKRRNRSLTPAGLSSDDLEAFAEACRSWCVRACLQQAQAADVCAGTSIRMRPLGGP